MKYQFHELALQEFLREIEYYEERQRGLGARIEAEVELAIGRIREAPLRWGILAGDVRRCRVQGFRFDVLYLVDDDIIKLVALMHHSRKPGYWRKRLTD